MKTKCFFSFHHDRDSWRASQIRGMGIIPCNQPVSHGAWELVRTGGSKSVRGWIDSELSQHNCTIVLIGEDTAFRKWIQYEIIKSWNNGNAIFGIYVDKLPDRNGNQSLKGENPFDRITIGGRRLSNYVRAYNPPLLTEKLVYEYIRLHLPAWLDKAFDDRRELLNITANPVVA